jgi:DNA repair protein RecO (recombination protein O)
MLRRTEGIVLRSVPFGEADLIVTYLTPDYGLIRLFAKSPRKIKSRFGSSLEPLTHSTISFWGKEDAALPKLTQSDIRHAFQTIRDKLDFYMKVSRLIELTISFMPERDANRRVFLLLFNTLKACEEMLSRTSGEVFSDGELIMTHFKIKFLEFAGFAPKLDSCGRCGNKGHGFYISHGSVMCESCARSSDSPVRLSTAMLKLYACLLTWDISKIRRIKPSGNLMSELSGIINMHIKYILARPLKTDAFARFQQ